MVKRKASSPRPDGASSTTTPTSASSSRSVTKTSKKRKLEEARARARAWADNQSSAKKTPSRRTTTSAASSSPRVSRSTSVSTRRNKKVAATVIKNEDDSDIDEDDEEALLGISSRNSDTGPNGTPIRKRQKGKIDTSVASTGATAPLEVEDMNDGSPKVTRSGSSRQKNSSPVPPSSVSKTSISAKKLSKQASLRQARERARRWHEEEAVRKQVDGSAAKKSAVAKIVRRDSSGSMAPKSPAAASFKLEEVEESDEEMAENVVVNPQFLERSRRRSSIRDTSAIHSVQLGSAMYRPPSSTNENGVTATDSSLSAPQVEKIKHGQTKSKNETPRKSFASIPTPNRVSSNQRANFEPLVRPPVQTPTNTMPHTIPPHPSTGSTTTSNKNQIKEEDLKDLATKAYLSAEEASAAANTAAFLYREASRTAEVVMAAANNNSPQPLILKNTISLEDDEDCVEDEKDASMMAELNAVEMMSSCDNKDLMKNAKSKFTQLPKSVLTIMRLIFLLSTLAIAGVYVSSNISNISSVVQTSGIQFGTGIKYWQEVFVSKAISSTDAIVTAWNELSVFQSESGDELNGSRILEENVAINEGASCYMDSSFQDAAAMHEDEEKKNSEEIDKLTEGQSSSDFCTKPCPNHAICRRGEIRMCFPPNLYVLREPQPSSHSSSTSSSFAFSSFFGGNADKHSSSSSLPYCALSDNAQERLLWFQKKLSTMTAKEVCRLMTSNRKSSTTTPNDKICDHWFSMDNFFDLVRNEEPQQDENLQRILFELSPYWNQMDIIVKNEQLLESCLHQMYSSSSSPSSYRSYSTSTSQLTSSSTFFNSASSAACSSIQFGLHSLHVHSQLSIPTTCYITLFSLDLFSFLMAQAGNLLYLLVWKWFGSIFMLCLRLMYQQPFATTAFGLTIHIIRWFQNKRTQRAILRDEVEDALEVTYDCLIATTTTSNNCGIALIHLREDVAHAIHPSSLRRRKTFSERIWPRVVSQMKHDARIRKVQRSVGNKPMEHWQWMMTAGTSDGTGTTIHTPKSTKRHGNATNHTVSNDHLANSNTHQGIIDNNDTNNPYSRSAIFTSAMWRK